MKGEHRSRRGFVDGPDGQIFFREMGVGPPIILLHQILRTSLDYEYVIPILASGHRVVAFDNVGCGDSDAAPEPYTLQQHAIAIAEASRRLGIERAAIVGHHSGANQALELALQAPELARCVVMSGLFYCENASELAELRAKAQALQNPQVQWNGSHLAVLWREGLQTNWGKPRFPPDRLDLLEKFFLEQIKNGQRRFEPYVALMNHDMSGRLAKLRAPCLFLKASDDIAMCGRSHLWLRDRPDAEFAEIEVTGGGEMPRLYPEAWATEILRFIRSAA